MRTVLVFRSELLPASETFILNQCASLRRFVPVLCGVRRLKGTLSPDVLVIAVGAGIMHKLLRRLRIPWSWLPGTFALAREVNASIVHAHFAVDAVQALPLVEQLQSPLVVTLHGYDVMCSDAAHAKTGPGRAYLRRRSALWARASVFVCVSKAVQRRAIEIGFPAEKLRELPIGIDVADLQMRQSAPAQALVLFVGRLVPKKGCDVLIEAFARLQRMLPTARLCIVGEGPERIRLEAMAAALTVGTAFTGLQSAEQVRRSMLGARCLAAPSITALNGDAEGLPTVLCEGLALGIPVASTWHSGIPELITHEETGLLSPEGDVAGLAENLLRLCVDDALVERLAIAGRRVVEERFAMDVQTLALEALYEEVIEGFAVPRSPEVGCDGALKEERSGERAEEASGERDKEGIAGHSRAARRANPAHGVAGWRPLREQVAWLLSGNVASIVFQAACFLMLGRMLGAAHYGALVGAVALVNIGSQFSSLGMEMVVLRAVARDRAAYGTAITRGFVITGCGFLVFMAAAITGGHLLLPTSIAALLPFLVVSDALFGKVAQLCSRALQAADKAGPSAKLVAMNSMGRMVTAAALCLWCRHAHAALDLLVWVKAYSVVSCVSMTVAVGVMVRLLGRPRRCTIRLSDLGEGLSFSLSNSSISVYNDIDKTMLVSYGMFAAAGIYGAAYRVIDVLSTPVVSLFAAASPRLFREGLHLGAAGAAAGAGRLLRWTVPFGLAVAVMLALAAPVMPLLFGHSYRGSTQVLQFLCLLPLLRGLHYAWGTAVTACSSQWLRTAAQAASAGLNFGLNLLLIPRWGWQGAAVTSIVTDGLLAAVSFSVLRGLVWRQKNRGGAVVTNGVPRLGETG
jgi:glycosyltransferase involved in cell wall biosynthesis/O-antigen/teichoic acid export membrane protein